MDAPISSSSWCALVYGWGLSLVCLRGISHFAGSGISRLLPWQPLRPASMLRRWEESCVSLLVHAWFTWHGSGLLGPATTHIGDALWQAPDTAEEHAALEGFMRHQLCSWAAQALCCVAFDPRRQDFRQMVLHHVVTLALVAGSMASADTLRVGAVVALLHDATDVLVELTKLSHYLDLHGRARGWIAEACFTANLVSWVATRTVGFSLNLVPAYTLHVYQHRHEKPPVAWALAGGLWVLACLHALWLAMFIRIVGKLTGGVSGKSVGKEYECQAPTDEQTGEGKLNHDQ